jgi:hypothetical protein
VSKLIRRILTGTIVLAGMGAIVAGTALTAKAFVLEHNFDTDESRSSFWKGNASAPASTQPDWESGWNAWYYPETPDDVFYVTGIEAGDYDKPNVTLSTWLITGEIVPLENGAEISFYTTGLFPGSNSKFKRV